MRETDAPRGRPVQHGRDQRARLRNEGQFARFGADPAFGSGPLATLIQDLFSILVYFGVVTVIVF